MTTKTKVKEKKEPKFSEIKNGQPPVTVKEDEEFEGSQQIVKIEKMDMPLATVEEAKAMWQQYQDLINALIKESDIVVIQDKRRVKKSGVNKIARFFGYSCEILRTKREDIVGPQGGKQFVWYAWVKAIAPNGRFRVEGAACSSTERRFAHLYHDVFAMAITRASNRAIQELAGMGELELEEESNETPQTPKPEGKTYKPKPNEEQGYKKSAVVNPKMPASPKQKEFIQILIDKLRNDYEVETTLEKPVEELNKGEAANLINKLITRGKEALKNVRKEIPTGEPPAKDWVSEEEP